MSNSFSAATSIGLTADAKDPSPKDASGTKINSSNLALTNTKGYKRDKTLASLGKGNINIQDKQSSDDTTSLNRDTTNISKTMVDTSYGVEVDATLDHRLLTKKGQDEIAEDLKKASFIPKALIEASIKDSVSIIGDRADGQTGFFENVENKLALFEGTKKFVNDPANQQARETLLNPDATTEEVKQANQELHTYVAKEMGIEPAELKLILDKQYKGFTSSEDGKIRVAANLHNTMGDLANTTVNETSDVADLQRDAEIQKTQDYTNNRSEYSDNFGDLGQDLLDNQYAKTTGTSINNVIDNKKGTDLNKPNELDTTVTSNTKEFNTLDKSKGAHRQLSNSEIAFLQSEEKVRAYLLSKDNNTNPSQEDIQGAQHELTQEALRQVDAVWNVVLGEENQEAKEFLANNSNEFKKDEDYYNPTVNANTANTNPDIYKNAQDKARVVLTDTDALKQALKDKLKDTWDEVPQILNDKIDAMSQQTLTEILLDRAQDIAQTTKATAAGYTISQDIKNTPNETLDNIYGEGTGSTLKDNGTTIAVTAGIATVVAEKLLGGKKGKSDASLDKSQLNVRQDDYNGIMVRSTQDTKAVAHILRDYDTEKLIIKHVDKGNLASGSGSEILAEALKYADVKPGETIKVSNIINKETKQTFIDKGFDSASESLVGKTTIRAFEKLGFEVDSMKFVKNGEIIDIQVTLRD